MATITIYLSNKVINGVNVLHLRDSEGDQGDGTITTPVQDNDTVKWTLDANSGISAITNIYEKDSSGNQNVFSAGPSKVSDTEWTGVIGSTASGDEAYGISYTLTDGTTCDDDPIIRVRDK